MDIFAGFPRAEVIGPLDANRKLRYFEYGRLYSITTSYLLPANYEIDPVQQELSFQIHHDCLGGSPSLAQVFSGGHIEWQIYSASAPDYCGGDYDKAKLHHRSFDVGPIIRGRWVDLQVTWRPAWDAAGILRVRMNGKLVVTYRGRTAYNLTNGHPGYLKEGIYKWCFKLPAPTCADEKPTPVKQRVVYYGPTLITVR